MVDSVLDVEVCLLEIFVLRCENGPDVRPFCVTLLCVLCLWMGLKLKVIYQVVYLEEGHNPKWLIGQTNRMLSVIINRCFFVCLHFVFVF